MSPQIILPISEHFHSLQGEGTYTGTPMHFIRLAGCNVGRHPSSVEWSQLITRDNNFPILQTGRTAYVCHTYDNRPFWCDTDFQHGTPTGLDTLLDETWEGHVCVTGGEPLLHRERITDFVDECHRRGIMAHIESSGTINWHPGGWLCISPKSGFIPEMIDMADEIKLLVDPAFKLESVPECIRQHDNVFVQPINNELSVDPECLSICMEVLRVKPDWKLSCQLHKFLNIR